jgi:hypothetical protein
MLNDLTWEKVVYGQLSGYSKCLDEKVIWIGRIILFDLAMVL